MNRIWKVLLPMVLVMALLIASMPAFAAESPTAKAIGKVKVSSTTYNGKKQSPSIKVYDTAGKRVSSKYYRVKLPSKRIGAGTYKIQITAKAPYTGTLKAKFVIKKARNPFKIKVGKKTFTRNKKKTQSTSISLKNAYTSVFTDWTTTSSKVFVKGGKLIIKKGFYGTATVSIASKESPNHLRTRKAIKITVKK